LRRVVRLGALGLAGVLLAALATAYGFLRASLPRLDGTVLVSGIGAPVAIERDALGVATVSGSSRADLAFGTGFAHGIDRFFQMDLARRFAAGELSELVGGGALAQDLQTRPFRFRALARGELERSTPAQRALLTAYTRGVNAGLASLRSRPWEYWLLGVTPAPWQPEDSFLVVYAMWWNLQHGDLSRDRLRRTLDAKLRGPQCGAWKCALQFLYPERTRWDAPNVADESQLRAEEMRDALVQAVPGPEALDARGAVRSRASSPPAGADQGSSLALGSNSWAVAGRFTATGAALVASDMHLDLQVPPTWYRVRLRLLGAHEHLDLNGLSLPGAPVLVAGSNGEIAWAFTNSDGDWLEARPVECLSVEGSTLRAPSGDRTLTTFVERVRVRGSADVVLPVQTAPEGVLFSIEPQAQRCWFAAWLAERPEATNMDLLALERARSVQEALALAPQVGIPQQNLVVGDRAGHIGWTIAGRVPRGSGDQRMSAVAGWLSAGETPQLYDPPLGRVWSANARASVDPAALATLGGEEAPVGAQYILGARARQIRDALLALTLPATPRDMLRIQLDDRAVFLAHWRELLLGLLDAPALAGHASRAEFRRLVATWDARAAVGSVGYRLVRAYYDHVASAAWQMMLGALAIEGEPPAPPQFEQPLWTLVSQQPPHLLSAEYPSWHAFLLAQLDRTVHDLQLQCGALAHCRWGAAHPVHIRNPLSRALPWLSSLIDYPQLELPGDHDMPRVQDGAFGASERFAVSPGREAAGYLELPGGQTDHPLSPYFRAGFAAWAQGQPLPFLPGRSEHHLLLRPRAPAVH